MDEQTKSMIQDMLKRGADNETIQAITGASQADIDKIAAEGKQGSLFDRLGIITNLQAAEMQPIEDLRTMPLGTQETFGEKLKPTIPTGGSIFTDRFKNFNQRVGETGIQQVVNPYIFTGFDQDVLKEEEDSQYLPEEKNIFQRSYDYLNDPTKNTQRGIMSYLLTANPFVAAASYFAPKIIGGIGNVRNSMSDFVTNLFSKPAAQIPANTFFGDTDMTRGGGAATSSSGQSVSSSDLSSIGNTGFSEYSSPGVASSYEGSF